jgi:hypothetical protein
MALAFRRSATKSETSAIDMLFDVGAGPLLGSTLIMAVACSKTIGCTKITPIAGESWNLLYESDGPVVADQSAVEVVRVQIWGAFNVPSSNLSRIGLAFSGGATPSERGVIFAEYTGDGFQFPNPADRVAVGWGQTPALTLGDIDILGGTSREAAELWIGVVAATPTVTFASPTFPFAFRVNPVVIGAAGPGRMALLDAFTSSAAALRLQVEHSDDNPSQVTWAAAAAAIRGILQVPATPVEIPSVGEPITENTDHEGDAIAHLLEQFKSHDKR